MLHFENDDIRKECLIGKFGLEKETLRITGGGFMSHTPHPFVEDPRISRDFCENQIEINTDVYDSIEEAVAAVGDYTSRIWKELQERGELLWPFSNPVYIINEDDIPVARFYGKDSKKTDYRNYLSGKYGRYKMTFSGIHYNFSFSDELLKKDFSLTGMDDYRRYKDEFYLDLAAKASIYGWIIVCITAASPLLDISFVEKHERGETLFTGMSSVRCSENGYWNFFTPLFDYSSVDKYAESIGKYVDMGAIWAPSELYYPIRLKPGGEYTLSNLIEKGVDHIELRMIDLNPFVYEGIDLRDAEFIHLWLVWLASLPTVIPDEKVQIQTVANFRNASRFDLKTVKIVQPDGTNADAVTASINMIDEMKLFFAGEGKKIQDILDFEKSKFTDQDKRYASRVKKEFEDDFVQKGLELAKEYGQII